MVLVRRGASKADGYAARAGPETLNPSRDSAVRCWDLHRDFHPLSPRGRAESGVRSAEGAFISAHSEAPIPESSKTAPLRRVRVGRAERMSDVHCTCRSLFGGGFFGLSVVLLILEQTRGCVEPPKFPHESPLGFTSVLARPSNTPAFRPVEQAEPARRALRGRLGLERARCA